MNDSLSQWLALREAADWSARSELLARRVGDALAPAGTVRGLDLCTGTGSNLRYLLDRLPGRQQWLVVDHDPALLAEVPTRLSAWAHVKSCTVTTDRRRSHVRGDRVDAQVETRQMNLERLDAAIFAGRNLVTASALLDLVSESWLRLLADRCQAARAVALFSITYNGQSSCDPAEPEDEMVRERVFKEAGYQVERASSDWLIEPREREFQRQLIDGWAHAASEIAPRQGSAIANWLKRRLAHVDAGCSRIVVGHVDMAALE
jgi:hypothetical protein